MHFWGLHSKLTIELDLTEWKRIQTIELNLIELKVYIGQAAWDVSVKLLTIQILVPVEYVLTVILVKTELFSIFWYIFLKWFLAKTDANILTNPSALK